MQLYLKSTFQNQRFIAVLCLNMRFLLLMKLCVYFGCIPGIFARFVYRLYVWRYTLLIKGYTKYTHLHVWCTQLVSHKPPLFFFFKRHVNDDSKYFVYTVSDKRKLNVKKIRTLTCINDGCKLKGGGGVGTNPDPRKTWKLL